MDMNPVLPTHEHGTMAYKDAIFFSGHKFLGGPGCPGVLVVKKALLPSLQEAPTVTGGGTVFYVTDKHHRFP
jgi:selenocysteine lyase/cysteine desulfurase